MKRFISTVLLIVLFTGLLPITAFAAGVALGVEVTVDGYSGRMVTYGEGSSTTAAPLIVGKYEYDDQGYTTSKATLESGLDINGDKLVYAAVIVDGVSDYTNLPVLNLDALSLPKEGLRGDQKSYLTILEELHRKYCPACGDLDDQVTEDSLTTYKSSESCNFYSNGFFYTCAGNAEPNFLRVLDSVDNGDSTQTVLVIDSVKAMIDNAIYMGVDANHASQITQTDLDDARIVLSLSKAFNRPEWVADARFRAISGITDYDSVDTAVIKTAWEQLGTYPTENFKQQAIWSARWGTLQKIRGIHPDYTDYISPEKVATSGLPDLDRYWIRSLYDLYDLTPPSYSVKSVDLGGSTNPLDLITATNAIKQYNSLASAGSLHSEYERMAAYKYKLQATMGLASGLVAASEDLQQSEIDDFRSTAYGTSMELAKGHLFADVTGVDSKHLQGNRVSTEWLYYLSVCYNELATYGSTIISVLGPQMANKVKLFSGYAPQLAGIQGLYDALSWADDSNLWDEWNADNPYVDEDEVYKNLKSIYDYLLSTNAFRILETYDATLVDGPMRHFFGAVKDSTGTAPWQLSDNVRTGIVASASFLPMKTNLYDPYTFTGVTDTSWLLNFHSKFGYNRKALYIDTNVDAAVNWQRTGTRGELRVCTLEDLLFADKDIVLYLDDNLYNVNQLSELVDKAYERTDNVDVETDTRSLGKKIVDVFVSLWDVSMVNIAKTAEVTTYSQKVQSSVKSSRWQNFFLSTSSQETAEEPDENSAPTAAYYLQPDDVWNDTSKTIYDPTGEHTPSSYTPLTAFAVLSAIYADKELCTSLNATLSTNTPVFISSPTLPYSSEVDTWARNSIYNYLLLKNLDSQMSVDYTTNLDTTSPVYMDIYGNIVTESGVVVVPSAANATLWERDWAPYNAAFFSTYGDDFHLEYDKDMSALNKMLSDFLVPDGDQWVLASVKVDGGVVDLSRLSTADKDSLALVTRVFEADLSQQGLLYSKGKWQMIVTEVLRGAPIEHIDKDFEGLNLSHRVTKNGLVVAEKLEFLVGALSADGTNATLSIPNPAFLDGIEYIVFFVFKALILWILVVWMWTIYVDAVGGSLSLRTGTKCIGAVALVLSLIVGVPAAFELSYYQSNKLLLQDEAEYLMMLNLEKREAGQEIGITKIGEPSTNTTLYLKLADIEIPWYDLLPRIITSSSVKSLDELYKEYEGQHPIANAEGITTVNDAVYITTDSLFDSSTISFYPSVRTLYQSTSEDTPASYYTPYYFFLEGLITKANEWVTQESYYAYTTKVQRGGKLKTLGYVQAYFASEDFMQEGMDYFDLYQLYDVPAPVQSYNWRLETQLTAIRESNWCNLGISEETRISRIEKLNEYCRKWVADNRGLIGKVTDETFLKCMALSCAMEHNRLFGTLRADWLEIGSLTNEDLMRLSMADRDTVMRNSTMSYARFVFSTGGLPAVYAAALLTVVNYICSWVKPLTTLAVWCITCLSIFVFRLILRKGNNSLYGYMCTILLMCCVNVVGSLALKLAMLIPAISLSPTVCILLQVIIQCGYMYALVWIVKVSLKDWRNMGFDRYSFAFNKLTNKHGHSVEVDTPKEKDGWAYYNNLVERQRRRNRRL